jgi:hypothetical protein
MSDRELLELAAKAIGLKLKYNYLGGRDANQPWDSLEDDGDALRLAVRLKIDVKHYDDYVVGWFDGGYIGTGKIMYEGDPYAATRRAITRAAAEIGKSM